MSLYQGEEKNIKNTLQHINNAWTQGHLTELGKYFHDNMVIQGPGFHDAIKGKRNCVKHYEDFSTHTNIISFKDSEYVINCWGSTAVASYKFDIEFEADGNTREESGHELYTFVEEANVWKAVWSTIVPYTRGAIEHDPTE